MDLVVAVGLVLLFAPVVVFATGAGWVTWRLLRSFGAGGRLEQKVGPRRVEQREIDEREFVDGANVDLPYWTPYRQTRLVLLLSPLALIFAVAAVLPDLRDARWIGADSVAGALALITIGTTVLGLAWLRYGRDEGRQGAVVAELAPPEGLRPAQIGLLINENIRTRDITATILDLAARGYLALARTESGGNADWRLDRTRADSRELREFETIVFAGLFAHGSHTTVATLRARFFVGIGLAEIALRAEATKDGWFVSDPRHARRSWLALGLTLALCGVVATGILMPSHGAPIGIALVMYGALVAASSHAMPQRTARGTDLRRRALGFRLFMETAERERERFAEREGLAIEYLPYAVVFDCVDRWADAFGEIGSGSEVTLRRAFSSDLHGAIQLGRVRRETP